MAEQWSSTTLKCEVGTGGVVLQESVNSYYCYPHTDLIFKSLKLFVGYKLHLLKSEAGLCGQSCELVGCAVRLV